MHRVRIRLESEKNVDLSTEIIRELVRPRLVGQDHLESANVGCAREPVPRQIVGFESPQYHWVAFEETSTGRRLENLGSSFTLIVVVMVISPPLSGIPVHSETPSYVRYFGYNFRTRGLNCSRNRPAEETRPRADAKSGTSASGKSLAIRTARIPCLGGLGLN